MRLEKSSLDIPLHIHSEAALINELQVPSGKILKAVRCYNGTEKLFIMIPFDKNLNLSKCQQLGKNIEISGYNEEVNQMFNYSLTNKIYLDRSLFFQPEYYVLDWSNRVIRLKLLEEIILSINISAWVDFTE